MSRTILEQIQARVKRVSQGHFFIIDDFSDIASHDTTKVFLNKLVATGKLTRAYNGIYQKPKINRTMNLPVPPKTADIVTQFARKNHARIVPAGNTALNMLGISTQVPVTLEYMTDGPSREIEVKQAVKVIFRHASTKKFIDDDMTTMTFEVINQLGDESMTSTDLKKIARIVDRERYQKFRSNAAKASKRVQINIAKMGDYIVN